MASTWSHPQLEQFKYDGMAWVSNVNAQGFDRFAYDTGYSNAGPPTGEYEMALYTANATEVPAAEVVELAARILANQADLVAMVIKAMWNDFNGDGPDSGMWWHNGLDQVIEAIGDESLSPLSGPDDLLALLRLFQIAVYKESFSTSGDSHGPVAELSFWAAFEEEHNVGVLTDGQRVLGLGYGHDVEPFESE